MTRSRILCTLGTFLALALTSAAAQAQYGSPNGFGPYGGYWFGAPYTFYQHEDVPYFALHPPVYYSLPVPRTYGYSPFAYPPGTMTPEIAGGGPIELHNPYVVPEKPAPKDSREKPDSDSSRGKTTRVQITLNPYVVEESVAAER